MKTIGELVGGPCDGVQLDPADSDEPDDWPDMYSVEDKQTGSVSEYWLKEYRPVVSGGFRVY
jgi:hypothetical protein